MEVEKRYEYEIKAFGKKLKELRKKRKLTQLDIEIKCGLDRTDVSRIENGLKNVEFYTIVKLAEALNLSLCEFFSNSFEPKQNAGTSKK